MTGIRREGNIFNVLLSLIPKIESPDAKMSTPPTIDTSVIKFSVKKGSKYCASK